MTTPKTQDKLLKWILAATTAICLLTLSAAVWTVPLLVDTRSSVTAQHRSDLVSSCRSEIRADLDLATAVVDDLILDGLTAAVTGDRAAVVEVVESSRAARRVRDAAVERVKRAADLSKSDPDRFLTDMC